MNNDELINKNKLLEEEIKTIREELIKTKEHLKKYTAPSYKKLYYENNKEDIKQKVKEQNYTPTTEQKKKWARTAYLNKKAKLEGQNI